MNRSGLQTDPVSQLASQSRRGPLAESWAKISQVKLGTFGLFLGWQRDDHLKPGAICRPREARETFRELLDLTFTTDLFLGDSDLGGERPGAREVTSQRLWQGAQVTGCAFQKDCEPHFRDNHAIEWLQAAWGEAFGADEVSRRARRV